MPGPNNDSSNADTAPLASGFWLRPEDVRRLRGLIEVATDPSESQDRRTLTAFRVVGMLEAQLAQQDRTGRKPR